MRVYCIALTIPFHPTIAIVRPILIVNTFSRFNKVGISAVGK